ncbi:hypothetical protein AB0H86_36620 [Streptomyces sp. NPDC050997]|uniref:hypothetical protein n=1 Tax=Streptomyces sp. NPDC050997 TaxID=3155519 RepID=UPI0034169FB4
MTNVNPPTTAFARRLDGHHPSAEITVDTVGTLRIGAPPAPAPFSAPLPALSGLLVFDPFAPDQPPYAELDGPDHAGAILPLTLGDDTTQAATDALAAAGRALVPPDAPADHVLARRTAPYVPGPAHLAAARLATLLWLSRWSPRPLDADLLDIEASVLLMDLDDVVEDACDTAREHLAHSAPRLVQIAHAVLRDRPLPGEEWVVELIAEALEHADDLLGGHSLHGQLRELAARARGRDRRPYDLGADLDAQLRRLLRPAHAVLGSPGRVGWRRADTDWAQVPPGLLSGGEGNIWWRVQREEHGRPVLSVRAEAASDVPAHQRLAFRVYVPHSPLPVAVGGLRAERGATRTEWLGSVTLSGLSDGDATDELTVDVFHPDHAGPARLGQAAERAKTERQAVRYLFELREFLARQEARGLRDWAQLVDADTSLHPRSPEDPLSVRMRPLAAAARAFADRLRGEDAGPSAPSAPSAPTQPRLHAAEWRPTLAEWGRLRRNFGR